VIFQATVNERAVISLVPYIVSFLISTGVKLYAWQRRRVGGALSFAVLAGAEAFWTFGYILELLGSSVGTKLFWDNVQWIATFTVPLALLGFTLDYTGQRLAYSRLVWRVLIVLTGVWVFIVFAYPPHELVRPGVRLVAGTPFSSLVYDFGPLIWAMSLYGYAIFAFALMFLINIVFLDLEMPKQDGFQTLEIIRSNLRLPVLVVAYTGVHRAYQRNGRGARPRF
jgi:CheY-like chemotaxis protein